MVARKSRRILMIAAITLFALISSVIAVWTASKGKSSTVTFVVRARVVLNGSEPVALMADGFIYANDSGYYVYNFTSGSTYPLNLMGRTEIAPPEIVRLEDTSVMVFCNRNSTLIIHSISNDKPYVTLSNIFRDVNECLSAHPVWGGDSYLVFINRGYLVNVDTGRLYKLNLSSKMVNKVNNSECDFYNLFIVDERQYVVYLCMHSLYIDEYWNWSRVASYSLDFDGYWILYAGFIHSAGKSSPLLYIVHMNSEQLKPYLAVYKVYPQVRRVGFEKLDCIYVMPLALNFGDIDGDGYGDVVFACMDNIIGFIEGKRIPILWLEVHR